MDETNAVVESGPIGTERLYDYTKFHAGLYAGLVFGTVALVGIGGGVALRSPWVVAFAVLAVGCWVTAGFAAGVILGNLVDLDISLKSFRGRSWGPMGKFLRPGAQWESLEHIAFWVGVGSALVAFGGAVVVLLASPACPTPAAG